MSSSPLIEKSYTFSIGIAQFCWAIQNDRREFVLTKQLLKSGTSIGANIEEATQAESTKDFISKLRLNLSVICPLLSVIFM